MPDFMCGSTALFPHCVPRLIMERKLEPPLPIPFELPHIFPASVMCELENGILTGKGKSKFVAEVAAAMFCYKSYPTKEEYDHVGQQIIEKYSFLRSSSGNGYVSGNLFCYLKKKKKCCVY